MEYTSALQPRRALARPSKPNTSQRAAQRGGGIFLLAEAVSPEPPFAAGVEEWKAKQPPRYTRENWERFWSRANGLLGYDHTTLLGPRHANRIGDGLSVAGWMRFLERAGFTLIDVLLRDADQVVIGAVKAMPDSRRVVVRTGG